MGAALLTDPLFLEHVPSTSHPESPNRLSSILAELNRSPIASTVWVRPRPASREELARVHSPELIDSILRLTGKTQAIDEDTATSPRSVDAALLAAGAAVQAVELVLDGAHSSAFALVRPPGHHAEPSRAMGFCLFNNIAIAATSARVRGCERVAIIDWDVHHGNGTQACFEDRRDILFLSTHQWPLYPGTGAAHEIGNKEGAGYTVNCALPPGMGDAEYGVAFQEVILPIVQEFRPDLILVSAGFDAHQADPLARMRVTERGFAAMTTAVRRAAEELCEGKLVLLLEGGYALDALAASVHGSIECLVGRSEEFPHGSSSAVQGAVDSTRAALQRSWRAIR